MKVTSFWFWETPIKINEPIVVIDAWAATTNLSIILSKNPRRLILVNEKNYQKALAAYPNSLLIGESYQLPQNKFVVSNYPSDIYQADLKSQSLLYMTVNGTRVFEKFKDRKSVIGCSLNNLQAVVDFLRDKKRVTIIMAGDYPNKVLEDKLSAQILVKELEGKKYDWEKLKEQIKNFIRPSYSWPEKEEKEGLKQLFAKSRYNIIPAGKINKEGFIEIIDLRL